MGWPSHCSWAAAPSQAGSLKIVYFTDIHARVEWGVPEAMMKAASEMNKHTPDIVLCGGDMITDGLTSGVETVAPRWNAYLAMCDAIHPRPEAAVGNHDLVGVAPSDGSERLEDPRAEARRRLGLAQTYRSFDRNGYHFMFLDCIQLTGDEDLYRGHIDLEQMEWIKSDLAAVDPRMPIILVCHMPLVTGFFQMTGGIQQAVPANRGVINNREVLALFEGHHLLLVLQGHSHVNEMLRWRETTFITGGAISGKWWRGSWHGTPEGFGVLDLNPGRVDWSYHAYGWVARRPAHA